MTLIDRARTWVITTLAPHPHHDSPVSPAHPYTPPTPPPPAALQPLTPPQLDIVGSWTANRVRVAIARHRGILGGYAELPPTLAIHLDTCTRCTDRLHYNAGRVGMPTLFRVTGTTWCGFDTGPSWNLWDQPHDFTTRPHPGPAWWSQYDPDDVAAWTSPRLTATTTLLGALIAIATGNCAAGPGAPYRGLHRKRALPGDLRVLGQRAGRRAVPLPPDPRVELRSRHLPPPTEVVDAGHPVDLDTPERTPTGERPRVDA